MSERRFLQTLQALLTMVDPRSVTSRACVKSALENIAGLARASGKCNGLTLRMIFAAQKAIDSLIDHHEDFASIPGDRNTNVARMQQLRLTLCPRC